MSFVSRFVADPKPKVELYRGALPIFDEFGIEAEIDANLGRKVWLKSGGYLIVDQSEALTAIDVNTGRYVGKRDLEETVLKTNLEAVKEVVHQLRFRNIGGLIIIDLIDMETAENREKVYRALQEALRQDKAQDQHPEDLRAGSGRDDAQAHAREPRAAALRAVFVLRRARLRALANERGAEGAARNPEGPAATSAGGASRSRCRRASPSCCSAASARRFPNWRPRLGREVEVRAVPGMHQEHFEVIALDAGPPVGIALSWLGTEEPPPAPEPITAVGGITASEPDALDDLAGGAGGAQHGYAHIALPGGGPGGVLDPRPGPRTAPCRQRRNG